MNQLMNYFPSNLKKRWKQIERSIENFGKQIKKNAQEQASKDAKNGDKIKGETLYNNYVSKIKTLVESKTDEIESFFNLLKKDTPNINIITKARLQATASSMELQKDHFHLRREHIIKRTKLKVQIYNGRIEKLLAEKKLYDERAQQHLNGNVNIPVKETKTKKLLQAFTVGLLSIGETPVNFLLFQSLGEFPFLLSLVGGVFLSIGLGFAAHFVGSGFKKKEWVSILGALLSASAFFGVMTFMRISNNQEWFIVLINVALFLVASLFSYTFEPNLSKAQKHYLKHKGKADRLGDGVDRFKGRITKLEITTETRIHRLELKMRSSRTRIRTRDIISSKTDIQNTIELLEQTKQSVILQVKKMACIANQEYQQANTNERAQQELPPISYKTTLEPPTNTDNGGHDNSNSRD